MHDCHLTPEEKKRFIHLLLQNELHPDQLEALRPCINPQDLAEIITHIYDLNDKQVMSIAALESVMGWVDGLKNTFRTARFTRKINKNFRQGAKQVVLAEGDSWFNYPIILSDVVDWIAMDPQVAVYSLANGGDWLLNMLTERKYVEMLSVLHPDVFLISGGGNDLVGRSRLAAIVDPSGTSAQLDKNDFTRQLLKKAEEKPLVPLDAVRFNNGKRFLSKDFYALLLFFHLQYYYLIDGILTGNTGEEKNSKFPGIRIITQGYDYPIPSHDLGFGLNPLRWYKPFIRMFLGHGSWLKTPLQMRGINDPQDQQDIVYAMIFLFNEMMIATGDLFCRIPGLEHSVFHVDSRGSLGTKGWTDELHALPEHFRNTGLTFSDCIHRRPSPHGQVYIVNQMHPKS